MSFNKKFNKKTNRWEELELPVEKEPQKQECYFLLI